MARTHLTLTAAIDAYVDWHALRGSSSCHQRDVKRTLGYLASVSGENCPIAEVTREHCEALLRSVRERKLKPNTLKAYHRTMDAFFHWLVAEERLEVSPMKRVPKPKLPQEQITPLSPDEVTRLLKTPDRKTFTGVRDAAFMALLVDTGLRLSEALGIRLKDLDPRARSISVMGKGGKGRTVFYGVAAANFLREYLKRRGEAQPEDLVFINSLGEPLCRFTLSKRVHHYGDQAGITGKRVSPHTLRHTFAVSWLINGADAFSLQRLLGHATPVMTARYVNFATGDLARLHRSASPLDRLDGNGGGAEVPTCAVREKRQRLR